MPHVHTNGNGKETQEIETKTEMPKDNDTHLYTILDILKTIHQEFYSNDNSKPQDVKVLLVQQNVIAEIVGNFVLLKM